MNLHTKNNYELEDMFQKGQFSVAHVISLHYDYYSK